MTNEMPETIWACYDNGMLSAGIWRDDPCISHAQQYTLSSSVEKQLSDHKEMLMICGMSGGLLGLKKKMESADNKLKKTCDVLELAVKANLGMVEQLEAAEKMAYSLSEIISDYDNHIVIDVALKGAKESLQNWQKVNEVKE